MLSAHMYEDDPIASTDKELNLGLGSLLGIFFGLALVCGVFFGFGYMMGHRNPGVYVSAEPLYVAPKPVIAPAAPKPSAQVLQNSADANRVVVPDSAPSASSRIADTEALPTDQAATAPTHITAPSPQLVSAPVSAPLDAGAAAVMVQIAAVKNRPDAEALASALRRNGFDPTIRTEYQDKLIHVQVGPFGNRDEARTMRQRLSSAGYNAFIK